MLHGSLFKKASSIFGGKRTLDNNPMSKSVNDQLKAHIVPSADQRNAAENIGAIDGLFASAPLPVSAIVNHVRSVGVLIFPRVVTGETLEQLRSEFAQFIGASDRTEFAVNRGGNSVNVRVLRPSLESSAYPATQAFFGSEVFEEICEAYLGKGALINEEIFVHETHSTNEPLSGDLHFDKRHTLKFWIYVDDVSHEDGPMRIVPNSAQVNRQMRESLIGASDSYSQIDNRDAEQEGDAVSLCAAAGSVLIHDTDVWHGASPVAHGHIRRIMRGHSRSAEEIRIINSKTVK